MTLTPKKKQIIILYGSSLIGVALGMLSSIVNTRFLSPTEYGDVRYVQNIIQFISIFLFFGYFHAGARLMTKSQDSFFHRRVKGVMMLVLFCSCALIALAMPICGVLHLDTPHIANLFMASIPVAICPILLNYLEQTTQGDNQMGRLALARLLPYAIYIPIAYIVYRQFGATSMKMQLLQLGIYSTVYLAIVISTRPIIRMSKSIWDKIKLDNHDYGRHLYFGSLVMVATNYLAGISLGYFNEDNSEVGFYTLALTVTSPLVALPAIVGTTYFKNFASQKRIPAHVIRFTLLLTLSTLIVFLISVRPVVVLLYSKEYASVATYASYLAFGYCIHGIGDMINRYLASHGQGRYIRNASIANGLFKIFGFTALVALFNTSGAIATTIICDVIYLSIMSYYYLTYIKTNRSHE